MIVVKIEMWPRGDEERRHEIGRMYIANTGSGTEDRGDYQAAVCRRGTTTLPRTFHGLGPKPTREGVVENYPRLSYNVWRLISRAVRACFPEEG